jgi:alpha-tubulin suppressor-like RCC1 family protein
MLGTAAMGASGAAAASPGASGWGQNNFGQLGDGTLESSTVPISVNGLTEVVAVAAGGEHSLALLSNGTVEAWGDNAAGQLGNASNTNSSVPVPVSGLSNVTAIAAGGEFSLALLSNGHVMAWGQNAEGQLGDTEKGENRNSNVPVEVSGLTEVTAISAGAKHALALGSDGRVKAWGSDISGQLGNGCSSPECNDALTPVEVKELGGVTAIAAGGAHSLALLTNGTVEAWGADGKGQLGNGTTSKKPFSTPVAVQGLIGAHAIAAGETHSLAALTGGEVDAWGSNKGGELGNNSQTASNIPIQVPGLTEVASVTAGQSTSAALQTSGNVWTWGINGEGQGGVGTNEPAKNLVPVQVSDIHLVAQISAGGSHMIVAGPQLPTVTAVSPHEGPPAGGTAVTVTGTNFSGVTAVSFGSTPATSYTVESPTQINAVAPAGSGVVSVTVTIAGGTSAKDPASDFSYVPIVTSVSPSNGSQEGGTKVTILGSNFEGVTAVEFGAVAATEVQVVSPTEVTATSPAGVGTVDVTLVGPGGPSVTTPADKFIYTASPPEIGRCGKAGKKHSASGKFGDGACTQEVAEKGKFEWLPGPGPKPEVKGTTVKGELIKFETVAGKFVICEVGAKMNGKYTTAKVISNIKITFTGCKIGVVSEKEKVKVIHCTSVGTKAEGVITTSTLSAQLGIIKVEPKPEEDQVGLEIGAPGNGLFMEFECEKTIYVFRGAAILPFKLTDRPEKKVKLKFLEDKGHQNVESFENEPKSTLTAQIGAAPPEQAGMIMTFELGGKEKMEVNLLH